MKLYIKHMVSLRCIMYVKDELIKLGLQYDSINLGIVDIKGDLSQQQIQVFGVNLNKAGLELIENKKKILVERVKNVIIQMIHYSDDLPKMNDSEHISKKLGYDYTYLSNIFSEIKGITIQQFVIAHRVERVKRLLFYNELTLTEIAWRLHYSSVAHLSSQFKKVTGFTARHFMSIKVKNLMKLETL